jgi:hypothetical protein
LLDRPIQYVVFSLTSIELPTNRLLPFVMLFLVFTYPQKIKLNVFQNSIIGMTIISLLTGTLYLNEYGFSDFVSCVGVIFPFFLGVLFSRINSFGNFFFYICILPAGISLIALLGIFDGFQLIDQLHYTDGELVVRPEIFTDQNFHFFYVFQSIPLIYFISKFNVKSIAIALIITINLWTLNELQTRSGVIFFILFVLLTLFVGRDQKNKNGYLPLLFGTVIIIFSGIAVVVFFSDKLSIVSRFQNNDFATAYHRLESFLFWAHHLFDFKYWLPFGNGEFKVQFGGVPHSNITAFYLIGGILALIGYVLTFVRPTVIVFKTMVLHCYKYTVEQRYLAVNVLAMFVVQQTLNLPFNEHVWFWCGVSFGLINIKKKLAIK